MTYRLHRTWNTIQGSLWFIPILIVLGSIGLAYLVSWLDSEKIGRALPFVLEAGPDEARAILSTIAGSMLTVASVAFSFTIVVFSFASSQYSSRTLHHFMDDNTNQVVLGALLGSFVYCLLILSTVRITDEASVPTLSVTIALLIALIDLILFILYIHHVAESIQAYHIVRRIRKTTLPTVQHIFPAHIGHDAPLYPGQSVEREGVNMRDVCAKATGYVQMVDGDLVMDVTSRDDLLVVMNKSVGSFIMRGETLARVGPAERVTPDAISKLQYSFVLGNHRTLFQDPLYGILQLSDIAVKALSPAINDPNTAVMALNQLGVILRLVAGKELPTPVRCDEKSKVRVIAEGPTFSSMVAQAFDQVRRYGMTDAAIPIKMLDIIGEVAEEVQEETRLAVLRAHAKAIIEDANRNIHPARDRDLINEKMRSIAGVLKLEPNLTC
ncbi:MAG TPA: DUF2254 domain-containing protein [Chloroflexia bacterium]|nr:DUF2254 domain-containing protein [Chloroflexia bacterium]